MLTPSTVKGLTILLQGSQAPIWRGIVAFPTIQLINYAAAAVTVACVFYSLRRLLNLKADPPSRAVSVLTAFSLLVVPSFALGLMAISPSWLTMALAAVSLALLSSHGEGRTPWWRFFLSGVVAALAAWEGLLGGLGALVVAFLASLRVLRHGCRSRSTALLWRVGFVGALLAEKFCLGLPWAALKWTAEPIVGVGVFLLFLTAAPLLFVVFGRERRWANRVWGLALVGALFFSAYQGGYWRLSACERLTRRVLDELGPRKIIVGGTPFDVFVRAFLPKDVRFVGVRSNEDREYLINLFEDSPRVEDVALILRDCYPYPEAEEAFVELGYKKAKPKTKDELALFVTKAREQAAAQKKKEAEQQEQERKEADTNGVAQANALADQALAKSLDEMLVNFEKIPVDQRAWRVGEARENIRRAWARGQDGVYLSSTLLALDMLLGDWQSAESDAIVALTLDWSDPAANAVLGNIRARGGQLKPAEKYLRKAVKGGGHAAFNDLAMLLIQTQRAAEAVTFAKRAVEKMPKDWNYRETLSQALAQTGDYEAALEQLDEAKALVDGKPGADEANLVIYRDRQRIYGLVRERDGEDALKKLRKEFSHRRESKKSDRGSGN